jgi:hypothetical protein
MAIAPTAKPDTRENRNISLSGRAHADLSCRRHRPDLTNTPNDSVRSERKAWFSLARRWAWDWRREEPFRRDVLGTPADEIDEAAECALRPNPDADRGGAPHPSPSSAREWAVWQAREHAIPRGASNRCYRRWPSREDEGRWRRCRRPCVRGCVHRAWSPETSV